jgi:hypothetical protein
MFYFTSAVTIMQLLEDLPNEIKVQKGRKRARGEDSKLIILR